MVVYSVKYISSTPVVFIPREEDDNLKNYDDYDNRGADNYPGSRKDVGMSKFDMGVLADKIEKYLEILQDVFIIPDHLQGSEKKIREAMEVTEKLIKKLRKGDRSVFKDLDDWNSIE